MFQFSTEVTSSKINSDNPLFQRTLKAYQIVEQKIFGSVLEIGCGEGYGIPYLMKNADELHVIDKSKQTISSIKKRYTSIYAYQIHTPPITQLKSNSFDCIVSFQVIEHIKDVHSFMSEIKRLLKPDGKAYISTPNKLLSIARNPWHYKEFDFQELNNLCENYFDIFTIKGINGNENTENYYSKNKVSVEKIKKIDILNLERRLPSLFLKIPYEFLNRVNRLSLLKSNKSLVSSITIDDYQLAPYNNKSLDLFCVLTK
ncbi:class I SAM-dependent methyltransferase [Mesoflavibacter zeaxanthinifaciens]|uniref:class I SAM-dependent methyltransferase n=1 Tax=Mesoflavibacter zeaxanthinifaciens TaxID=393060 RepID=UPI003A910EFA